MTREEIIEAIVETVSRQSRADIKRKYSFFDDPEAGVCDQRDFLLPPRKISGLDNYVANRIVQSANSRDAVETQKGQARGFKRRFKGVKLSRKDAIGAYKNHMAPRPPYLFRHSKLKRTERGIGGHCISAANYHRFKDEYDKHGVSD